MSETLELWGQFPLAIAAGLLVGATCSVLGTLIILKRAVFIGIVLSEVAICGIALSFVAGFPPLVGSLGLTLGSVGLLAWPYEQSRIPRDTVLGLIFVLATAGALLLVSHSGFGMQEIKSLVYGDLILAGEGDLRVLIGVLVPVLAGTLIFLRPLLNTFLDRDMAQVLGIWVAVWEGLFFAGLGLAIAVAARTTGAGLVFAYLTAPPAAALLLSRRLPVVLTLAIAFSAVATLLGLYWSFQHDWPTNPSICLAACALFIVAVPVAAWRRRTAPM
jgi:ABC-type Mn2+/Zn2+ transport system permease subunit